MDNPKTFCFVCVFNEERAIGKVLDGFRPDLFDKWIDELIVIDDCSTDNTPYIISKYPYRVIGHKINRGIGAAHKTAIEYAQNNSAEIIVIMAGNGKMLPSEIPDLLSPIIYEGYDYIQGSRYIRGGCHKNIPLIRYVIQRLGSSLIRILFGWPGNDVSCGFKAIRMSVFKHKDINVFWDWLERYRLEPYLMYKLVKNKFKIKQVPVSMIYPQANVPYTKMPPIRGLWQIASPWIILKLGLKK